jgi:hypothetical protein
MDIWRENTAEKKRERNKKSDDQATLYPNSTNQNDGRNARKTNEMENLNR